MNEFVRDISTLRTAGATATRGKSVIQQGLTISGEIRGDGDLSLEGELQGDVHIQGTCSISESGTVKGNVEAEAIHIAGNLEGNASASKTVQIHSTGRVVGDVMVPNISIADGAAVNGRVTVGMEGKKK